MKNIRRISKERIKNFQTKSGMKVKLKRLQHMITGPGMLDINRANNWIEALAAERITIEPMHQAIGENKQLTYLHSAFKNVKKHRSNQVFLHQGKRIKIGEVSNIRTDIDAEIEERKADILLSLKCTQSNAWKGGGSQNHAFDQLIDLIQQAPSKSSNGKVWLGLYVSGGFWSEPRNEYRNYQGKFPITCFDLLKTYAKNKKCIVFTDKDLPTTQTTFYSHFIKGY